MTPRMRIHLAVAVLLVLVTACGSTVQLGPGALQGAGGQGLQPGNAGLGLPGATGTGAGSSPIGGPGSSPTFGGGFTPGGPSSFGSTAQGVSATKILIGLTYATSNGGGLNSVLGADDIVLGDTKADQNAFIDDINKHGGILGRKIVPIWHAVDSSRDSAKTGAQLMQERCETWRSARVFAAFDEAGDPTLFECTRKAGILLLSGGGLTSQDAATFRRYPTYVEVASINYDRIAANQISALAAQGYFSPWNKAIGGPGTGKAKVGILGIDTPSFRHAVEQVMRPALRRLGYDAESKNVVYVKDMESPSDLSAEAAGVSNAVLKFNSNGVTHVQILDVQARLTLEFAREADSQRYYPRFGLNSQNGAQELIELGYVQASQFKGAMGFGWFPSFDIPNDKDTDNGPYSNATRRQCLKVLKAHGIDEEGNAAAVALGYCDEFYFFRLALTRGGTNISINSYLAGVNSISSFQPATSFVSRFSPTRHDGISAIRYLAFHESCGCVEYASNLINIG